MKYLKKVYNNMLINRFFSFLYFILKYSYDENKYRKFKKNYDIDTTFKFTGPDIIFFGKGDIIIGENSYICKHSILEVCENCKIIIGKNCAIGPYVKMYTYGKKSDQNLNRNPLGKDVQKTNGNIIVGDGCWIGANVGIIGGVTIGNNAVIGMNSVVTKDIPPHSIAVGCPARVVKFKSYLSDKEKINIINKYKLKSKI